MIVDITDKVEFLNPEDECLSILKCVCGQEYPSWTFIIDIYEDMPVRCPKCNRGLFFRNEVRIFEVK